MQYSLVHVSFTVNDQTWTKTGLCKEKKRRRTAGLYVSRLLLSRMPEKLISSPSKKKENISFKIGFLFYFGVMLSAKFGMYISLLAEFSLWY